jgi:prepilin-type N-terminal cleavage/methylation domain-containing protein
MRGDRTPAGRAGFSLVELLVAIVILVIGILGLTAAAAIVTRQMGSGVQQTVAASVAQSRFELLTSRSCAALRAAPTGSATTRGVRERWRAAPAANNTMLLVDALTFTTLRGSRTTTYQSMRACE